MVDNAFIRIVDNDTGKEEIRYDLTEDYDRESAVVFGELYRHNGGWKFRAVGQGYNGGLAALCKSYGIWGCTRSCSRGAWLIIQPVRYTDRPDTAYDAD